VHDVAGIGLCPLAAADVDRGSLSVVFHVSLSTGAKDMSLRAPGDTSQYADLCGRKKGMTSP